ncbi:MAG: hypothetical protein QXO71_07155 [Candidatus Jordarchaeaceae archaeon]
MKAYKVNGFTMFEKAPYEKPDPKALMELHMVGPKEREKVYGAAFTTTFIKYALRAAVTQTGEKQPEDIKTLDQLKEYLLSKMEKLTTPPYYILIWAQYVTDKKLEGSLAAGTQIMYKGITKKIVESKGDMIQTDNVDICKSLLTLRQLAVDMKVAPLEFGYRDNGDGTIDLLHSGCHFLEGCKMSREYDLLKRPDGRHSCGVINIICQYLKMVTGKEWDYEVIKFDEQSCIAKCFPL